MSPELDNYLIVGAILFCLGMLGFLTRRNLILMMLSAELMLHGVSLNLVAFSKYHGNYEGQAFTVFVLTIAASEAAIALALILALFQRRKTLDIQVWHSLGEVPPPARGSELGALQGEPAADSDHEYPKLDPAGQVPTLTAEEIEAYG